MVKSEELQSVRETKAAALLAGTTAEAQAGEKSSENLKHGEESHEMLLALLTSPLETMINNEQARVVGSAIVIRKDGKKVPTTIIYFYGTEPTGTGTLHAKR